MRVWSWVRNLVRRGRVEGELDAEVRGYLELLIDEKVARGVPLEKARRMAMVELGGGAQVKQAVRDGRAGSGFESFLLDLRFGVRTLMRDRAFTVIAVLILGLGIGANVAVFSVVNTILLQPLPFPNADRLVWAEPGKNLEPRLREAAGLGAKTFQVSDFEAFQRENKSFESLTSYNAFLGNSEYTLTGSGQPQGVAGVMVAGNFFQTLGVEPALGRLFSAEEMQKNGRAAVLLSDGFWRRQFNADPAIVGQTVQLNKKPVTVVGVMPASFDFGAVFAPGLKFDIYTPAVMDTMRDWGNTLSVVGRLKPGVTLGQAQAESDLIFKGIKAAHPEVPFDFSPTLTGLKEQVSGKLRRSVIVLWSAVGLVLLIVCVNLSSLLVARSAGRSKEFAMRAALGAGRGRLMRQLLTESLVLACAGAALGLGLAYALTSYVAGTMAGQEAIALPLLGQVRVDGAALGWTLLITLVTTLVFGLVPGLRVATGNVQAALKDGGHGMSAGGRHERLRSVMVIAEVAVSCVLLVGGGLLLRSFLNALHVEMGFDASRASVMKIDYDQSGDGTHRGVVLQKLLRGVEAIPGVKGAAVADMLPLGRNRSWQFWAKEHPPANGEIDAALVRIVTPGYLAAMGMHLRTGRDFSWQDIDPLDAARKSTREHVVILNEAAARHFWPGVDAMGRLGVVDGGADARVVGIVSDVRQTSLESAAGPEIYLPVMEADPEGAELVVRSDLPASALSTSVMAALRAVNPGQPAYELEPLMGIVDHAVSSRRFFVVLVGSFAGLGLVLASLGIYGVIAYSVAQRTQEIGIRMALGATMQQVQISVMGKTLRLAAVGIAVGTVVSFVVARTMAALLFGTGAADPGTYLGMVGLLAFVALVAGYIPARRAARIDPAVALRP